MSSENESTYKYIGKEAVLENIYKTISLFKGAAVFDIELNSGEIKCCDNFVTFFGYPPIVDGNSPFIFDLGNIHKADMDEYLLFCTRLVSGCGDYSIIVRIKNSKGQFVCSLIELSSRSDIGARIPDRLIGRITDFTEHYKTYNEVLHRSKIDLLTGLYNKVTGETIVKEMIEKSGKNTSHALIVFDIDNLKIINDSFGHLLGDSVIVSCANIIKSVFRDSDIISRFGGDELIVFISQIQSEEIIKSRVDKVNSLLKAKTINDVNYNMSLSSGIAFYPRHGDNFITLYDNADKALYQSKREGKGKCLVYNEKYSEKYSMESFELLNNLFGESDNKTYSSTMDLTNSIFNSLYGSEDVKQSIKHVLSTIAQAYDIDSAVIYECDAQGSFNLIYSASSSERRPAYGKFTDYNNLIDFFRKSEDSSVYTADSLPQEIWSQLGLDRAGVFFYFLLHPSLGSAGSEYLFLYDSFITSRTWSRADIAFLSSVSKQIGLFLR